jgi:hypothetical protein
LFDRFSTKIVICDFVIALSVESISLGACPKMQRLRLSAVGLHKVHGRLIDAATARRDLGLHVKLLAKNDPFWQIVWEYYTRTEIHLGNLNCPKMFETVHETLNAIPIRG